MKRRALIFLIAGTTFLAGFGGVAALLSAAPHSVELEPAAQWQETHIEPAPILIADGSEVIDADPDKKDGDPPTEGNSWSG